MTFLYTFNDSFVPQVASSIASICLHNSETAHVDFYLVAVDVSTMNINKLQSIEKNYNCSMHFVFLPPIDKLIDFPFDTLGWNSIILARIFMGSLLPQHINRIIYLDGDTIVRGPLDDLWNCDLHGKMLGMSIEPTVNISRKADLGLSSKPYYNSGVMLVDLDKWRNKQAEQRVIDFYRSRNGRLFAADQDAINGALYSEIHTISPRYNYYNIYDQYPYSFLKSLMGAIPYISIEDFNASKLNPVIIHFLGEERPWRSGNLHRFRADYRNSLNTTPWSDIADENGWMPYFFCWYLFNFFTKPFPALRYYVIDHLIPVFMKIRSKQANKLGLAEKLN